MITEAQRREGKNPQEGETDALDQLEDIREEDGSQVKEAEAWYVDLAGVADREGLHDRLSSGLDLPDWYGRNLDALYDLLGERQGRIIVTGWDEIKETLPGYSEDLRRVFEDAAGKGPDLEVEFR